MPNVRQYIGARYVTKVYENSLDPSSAEWENGVNYEPLVLVTYNNGSYLSKKDVPASIGDPATHPQYWVQTGFYNGQILNLQQQIDHITKEFVTPEMFGAAGDGATDDTIAVQDALNSGANVLLVNEYLIVADASGVHHGLIVPSDIIIEGKGKLILDANNYTNYDVLYIKEQNNVIIRDITIIGDAATHTGSTGEWGHGIIVDDSTNVTIDNVKVSACWGDGIVVTHLITTDPMNQIAKNVNITNSLITGNGRNNISVIRGEDINISNCVLSGAYRTAPKAGLCIEPNTGYTIKNCHVDGCTTFDNDGMGIAVNHLTTSDNIGCVISNCVMNDATGLYGYFAGSATPTVHDIIEGNTFYNSKQFINGDTYAALVINNNFKMDAATSEIPIVMNRATAVFKDNYISEIRTNTTPAIEMKGAFSVCEGNIFKTVQTSAGGYLITMGTDAAFVYNTTDIINPQLSGVVEMTSTSHVNVSHNTIKGRSQAPVHMVVAAGLTTDTEKVALNDMTLAGTVCSPTGLTQPGNVVNNTFVA